MAVVISLIGFLFLFTSCSPIQFAPESRFVPIAGSLDGSEIGRTGTRSRRSQRDERPSVSEGRGNYGEFPLDSNVHVDRVIIKYSEGSGRYDMTRFLERSTRYIPLIQELIEESGLPEDLMYLPMTESGFNPWAVSKDKAVGLWQFLKGTAQDQGLRINQFVDERRDPVLSTLAAIKYLKRLYNIFGDWRLALASYHAGEGFISKAVFNSSSSDRSGRDFWVLFDLKKVGPNTREYIPKVIAFTKIAKNPRKYDFYNLDYQSPLSYELIRIRRPSSLSYIADRLRVPLEELKNLNAMYLGDYVPVYDGETYIRVPDYL